MIITYLKRINNNNKDFISMCHPIVKSILHEDLKQKKYAYMHQKSVLTYYMLYLSGLYVWLVSYRSWARVPSKASVVSLSKKR